MSVSSINTIYWSDQIASLKSNVATAEDTKVISSAGEWGFYPHSHTQMTYSGVQKSILVFFQLYIFKSEQFYDQKYRFQLIREGLTTQIPPVCVSCHSDLHVGR